MMNKKGQVLAQMSTLAVGIATLAIILVVTFLIMAEGKSQAVDIENIAGCNATTGAGCGASFNATSELQGAVDDIPGWVPLIVIAVIGSILLGLVRLFR